MFGHWREFYWHALRGDFSGHDAPGAPWPGFYAVRIAPDWRPCAVCSGDLAAARVGILAVPRRIGFELTPVSAVDLWLEGCWRTPLPETDWRMAVALGHLADPRLTRRFLARPPAVDWPDVSDLPPIPPPV